MQNDSTPRALLIWLRPLRPCSPDETSRRHSSVRSCSRAECRGLNNTTHHLFLDMNSFWVLSLRFFIRRMSHWRRTVGSGPLSPSSPCTPIMTTTKLDLQLSSSGVPHVHGGITMWLCSLRVLGLPRHNSRQRSGPIIFPQG